MKTERKKGRRKILTFLLISAVLFGCMPMEGILAQEETSYEVGNPVMDSEGLVTWDCVYFGNYWQNDTNGDGTADKKDAKEPVKWRVLSVNGNDAFLLADQGLDCQLYNDTIYRGVAWKDCTLRSWLNGYDKDKNVSERDYTQDNFLNEAFSEEEKAAIIETEVAVQTPSAPEALSESDEKDKVYLLSASEIEEPLYGLASDARVQSEARKLKSTEYAKMRGVYASTSSRNEGNSGWWLRTDLSELESEADIVTVSGGLYNQAMNKADTAVRPVLHLDLTKTSCWTYAGTVTSKGNGVPPATPTPEPTESPSAAPTLQPTESPSAIPTLQPTESPSIAPTLEPTESPSTTPTPEPTGSPSVTEEPVQSPTVSPEQTQAPTGQPSQSPAGTPAVSQSPAPDKNLTDIKDGLGVSEETAVKIQKTAEELNVAKDTILITEQTILSQKTDDDIKGSYFTRIQAKAPQITQNNIKLTWNRVKGADGYQIYGNRCNTKKWIYEYKKMKTITNGNKKSFIDRKCKKGTYHKYIVRAYKIIDGKKVTIAASKTIHVTTTGGKYGNAKYVKVNKKKLSLKSGKKYRIRAKEIKESKPLRHHKEVSYESGSPEIATVSKKGVVKAKKKGSCMIYAYAQNGKYRKIKVGVK